MIHEISLYNGLIAHDIAIISGCKETKILYKLIRSCFYSVRQLVSVYIH